MWTFSSSRIVRFLLVPLLSLWVAGGGCLLGCEGMVAAAAVGIDRNASTALHSGQTLRIVASGHACSSGGSAAGSSSARSSVDTDKSHNRRTKSSPEVKPNAEQLSTSAATFIDAGGSSSGMMKDCPLAGSKAAAVTKNRHGDASASPAVAYAYLPAQNLLEHPTPLSTPPLLPNRGHTYLRCCVFLI